MDTALSEGDFLINSKGHPISIDGASELIQQALIRLSVKKGSFTYDKELGSNLYKLKTSYKNDTELKQAILIYAKEALEPMKNVKITGLSIEHQNDGENLEITFELTALTEQVQVEVTI